jgi:hypothetical protein
MQYVWTIEPASPSGRGDEPATERAGIQRIAAPVSLDADVRRARPGEAVNVYAAAGIWYDALDAISEDIASHPDDSVLRQRRAALLGQVGLNDGGNAKAGTATPP